MKQRFGRLCIKVGRYAAFLRHLSVDGLWRYRGRVAVAWVTAAAALGLQITAITLALYFAHGFQKDDVFDHFVVKMPFRSIAALLWCAGITLVLLLIASAAQFVSRDVPLLIWREYAEICSRRAIDLLHRGGAAAMLGPVLKDDTHLISHVRTDSSLCGRVLSLLIAVFMPMAILIAACAVLLYLEPWLTLLLMALAAVAGLFIFRTNVRATAHAAEMDAQTAPAARAYRRLVQDHKWSLHVPADAADDLDAAFRSGAPGAHLRAYIGRLQMLNVSDLVGGLFMAVASGLILVMLGGGILRQGVGWERLVVYLVALRYAMTSFRGSVNRFTAINLFYAQVRRYFEFVEPAKRPCQWPTPRDEYAIRANRVDLDGSSREVAVRRGDRIALVTPIEINRYSLAQVLGCLLVHESEPWRAAIGSARFVSSRARCNGRLTEALGWPQRADQRELNRWLDAANQEAVFHNALCGLNSTLTADQWSALDPALRFVLVLAAAVQGEAQWLLLDGGDLDALSGGAAGRVLDLLCDRIAILVRCEALDRVGKLGETSVIVTNKGRVIGMGGLDWFGGHRHDMSELMRSLRPAAAGPGTSDSREDDIIDVDMDE